MKEYFIIEEVSRLFKVKMATLKYYDEIGLLRPELIDEKAIAILGRLPLRKIMCFQTSED